jgi:transposase
MARHKGESAGLRTINEKAAGIDIGSRFHVVAMPIDRCAEPVQTYQAHASRAPVPGRE